jgi:ABC-2 type transport system permease protein
MMRHLHLIKIFWKTAIAAEMEYRLNFVFAALTSLGGLAGSLFGLFLFYNSNYKFAGWEWYEALLVVGFFTLLEGFSSAFLASNLNRIVKHVEQGTLDFVLLKPISSQFWLSTHSISLWGLPDMLFGIAILVYAGSHFNPPLALPAYALTIVPLTFGIFILYSLWFMLGATSIWFTKIYNVTEVLRGLLEAGRFPLIAYPEAYRIFFKFIVPVSFLTTVPAETLRGHGNVQDIAIAGLLALGLLGLSNLFWRFALRFYTSASS